MRLSYTNPITGEPVRRDVGVRYLQVDGVVLEVRHYYRSRGAWTLHAYREHFSPETALDWIRSGKDIVLVQMRRTDLLAELAQYITTAEWREKRDAWLSLTDAASPQQT